MLTDEQIQQQAKEYECFGEMPHCNEDLFGFIAAVELAYFDGYKAAQEAMQPRRIGELDKEFRGYLIGYNGQFAREYFTHISDIHDFLFAKQHFTHFFIPPTLK